MGVVLAVLGIVFAQPVIALLGGQGAMLENAVIYTRIILLALPFNVLQMLFQAFCTTAEKPQLGLFGHGGLGHHKHGAGCSAGDGPASGIQAGRRSGRPALSQVVGGGVPLLYFGRKNSSLLRLGRCRPDGKVILQACTNGSSEFMSNIAMSLVSMLYNLQLLHFAGEDGVAAYGVMMYVSMIFSAAFIGYSIGAAPIVSFHFGARNHGELQSLLRKSLRMIGLFGAAMVLSSQALALSRCRKSLWATTRT